jgi:hypothetical protein
MLPVQDHAVGEKFPITERQSVHDVFRRAADRVIRPLCLGLVDAFNALPNGHVAGVGDGVLVITISQI